jgi:hypothetical protein
MLDDLEIALRQNEWLGEILERFEEVALPDGWLVAGCIAQTIWNLSYAQPAEFGLKDVDLIYFDEQDLSFETEASYERRLRDLFQHLPIKLDVKNEARVHLCTKTASAMRSNLIHTAPTRSQRFQPRQPPSGYVGYAENWSAAHPLDLTICLASLSDRINGR